MAGEDRWDDHPLIRSLTARAREVSFFEAVRLVQGAFPEAARVGMQGPPQREPLAFRSELGLSFPGCDVSEIRVLDSRSADHPRIEVTTSFLGVYGPSSPLPTCYTEDLFHEEEDGLARAFLDIFNHRAISLFYRAWQKYRYAMQFQAGGRDPVSRRLIGLLGLEADHLPAGLDLSPVRLLAYAGLLTQRVRSASALEGMLTDYFGAVPVRVEQCTGNYLEIDEAQQNRIGQRHCRLGVDTTIGNRVFDRAAGFRIHIGPVALDEYIRFLPEGKNMTDLREVVRLFDLDALDYDVEVRLDRDEVPDLKLSSDTARLGWSTWLGGRPETEPLYRHFVKG